MRTVCILTSLFLLVAGACVKIDAPTDDRVRPYSDSGLSMLQVGRDLKGAGLSVTLAEDDLKDAERFGAANGIKMSLDCDGQIEPFRVYRFPDEATYTQAVERIAETERAHRGQYPGFVFRFAFNKNLLLLYDEVGRECRPQLVAAFEDL